MLYLYDNAICDDLRRSFNSIGDSMPLVNVIDPEGAVTIAEDGEILVNGPCVMKGYYKDDEANNKVLRDGVYHTGDYGRINSAGRLVLLQRNPDIILLDINIPEIKIEKIMLCNIAIS